MSNKTKKAHSYFGSKQHKNNIRKTKLGRKFGKTWKTKAKANAIVKAKKLEAKALETKKFFEKLKAQKNAKLQIEADARRLRREENKKFLEQFKKKTKSKNIGE